MQASARIPTHARRVHRPQADLAAMIRRKRLEQRLEHLLDTAQKVIDALDAIDGDPDLEPSLGSQNPFHFIGQEAWTCWPFDDREQEYEEEEDYRELRA